VSGPVRQLAFTVAPVAGGGDDVDGSRPDWGTPFRERVQARSGEPA
jgi:hypothetical protein